MKKYLILMLLLLSQMVLAQWVDFSQKPANSPILLQDFAQNFDYLKNKIIFEGKSSPLVSGEGQVLTDGTSNILFTEVRDSHNLWNEGGAYMDIPANKEALLSISGSIMLDSAIRRFISVYKNGNHYKNCSNRNDTEDIIMFTCKVYVIGGERLSIRLNNGDGRLSTTTNRSVYHHIIIHEE